MPWSSHLPSWRQIPLAAGNSHQTRWRLASTAFRWLLRARCSNARYEGRCHPVGAVDLRCADPGPSARMGYASPGSLRRSYGWGGRRTISQSWSRWSAVSEPHSRANRCQFLVRKTNWQHVRSPCVMACTSPDGRYPLGGTWGAWLAETTWRNSTAFMVVRCLVHARRGRSAG